MPHYRNCKCDCTWFVLSGSEEQINCKLTWLVPSTCCTASAKPQYYHSKTHLQTKWPKSVICSLLFTPWIKQLQKYPLSNLFTAVATNHSQHIPHIFLQYNHLCKTPHYQSRNLSETWLQDNTILLGIIDRDETLLS